MYEAKASPLIVLLAEDDQFVREMCGAQLRASGYRVMETATGDDALLIFQGGGVDVLVTDICMPGGLDGWSLAEQARVIHSHIALA